MAESIQVAGAVTVRVGTGASEALETLTTGGLLQGSEVAFHGAFIDVHTDGAGGPESFPEDVQYMSEIAVGRLLFSRWDKAISDKIVGRVRGSTPGTPATPGTLMFGGDKQIRFLLNTPTDPYNFPRCIVREPVEINRGTKHSVLVVTFTAYKNAAGVLYNNSIV